MHGFLILSPFYELLFLLDTLLTPLSQVNYHPILTRARSHGSDHTP